MRKITTTIFIFAGLALSGCMKTPDINKDFGTEFSVSQLSTMLSQAQSEATQHSVNNIKQGEFAYFEKTNQIENLSPMIIRQRADTVTSRIEDNKKILYTITHQLRELDSTGNMKPSQSQSNACLEKVHGSCDNGISMMDITLAAIKDAPLPPDLGAYSNHLGDLSWQSFQKRAQANAPTDVKWTYYNLVKSVITVVTPYPVYNRCLSQPAPTPPQPPIVCNPTMKVIQVSFDEVDWTTEKYPVKYSYVLGFSAEAPFFASQMSSCGSTTIPYQNQRIALLQCESVKDFILGHD